VIELRRPPGEFARVGHRGAPALVPENTLRSLVAAVELGCDMLELDVMPLRDGRIVLAHSRREVPSELAALEAALALCSEQFPNVGLQLDVKRRGV
jgi:glycerophosphoryl diester phosphodiesterase